MEINGPKKTYGKLSQISKMQLTRLYGINEVEILEKPKKGLVGLKWKETRTLFGKQLPRSCELRKQLRIYPTKTQAESHGAVYTTQLSLSGQNNTTTFTMSFNSESQTFGAKLMSATIGFLFKNATKKALMHDLSDIKLAVKDRGSAQ